MRKMTCILMFMLLSAYTAQAATFTQASGGDDYTVAIKSDGTLWTWGLNTYGQLGDGTTTSALSPKQTGADTTWSSIAAGGIHAVALKTDPADGNITLWTWGLNTYGQLGDGSTTSASSPTLIASDINWTSVSAGANHTVALKTDSSDDNITLWTWGYNADGQLGDGSTTSASSPTLIASDLNWTSVSAGANHTVALKTDSSDGNVTLWAWGLNTNGQIGDGSTTSQSSPTLIASDINWTSVSAGDNHTVAIKSDGTLWAWGLNTKGQLGDATTTSQSSPTQIGADTTWTNVSAGANHTVAIKSDGTLWAWGLNNVGQLGDGTTIDSVSPKQIGTDIDWSSVSVGANHTVAIKSDGAVWSWGKNTLGQLGNGTTTYKSVSIQVGTDTNWSSISSGLYYSISIKNDGTLWAWGLNSSGQLGDGTTVSVVSPKQIGSDTNWSSISTGYVHTISLKSDGTLWAWGENSSGQLGDGSTTNSASPIQIGTDANWTSVSSNGYYNIALKSDGSLWAWGQNSSGQLGDGTTTDSLSPIQIGTDTTWSSISTGENYTIALKNDGTRWAWGLNNYGQLGDGTTTTSSSPIQADTNTTWSSVSSGWDYSISTKSDGTLWAWGRNNYGQIGDGTTTDRTSPVQIGTGTTWSSVSAGYSHASALKSDGTLWAWGRNNNGQLGDGTTTSTTSPTQIKIANNWSSISGGYFYTAALKSDNTLWEWGVNAGLVVVPKKIGGSISPSSADVPFTIDEDTSKTFASSDFSFVDADTGDTLQSIVITTLPNAGTLKLNGTDVTLNQDINASEIANLVFAPNANANGTPYATVGFKVHDGNTSSPLSYSIGMNVNAIADAPTSANASFTINEDTSKVFASANFSFSDVDAGDTLKSIFITTLNNAGTLRLNGTDVVLNQEINTSDISGLVFAPAANANGVSYATFGFKVSDGSLSSIAYTDTINVNAVDDAPTLAAIANVSTLEDFADSNITLIGNDIDSAITYSASSSNDKIATVSIVNGKLVVTQLVNAYGLVKITVNATSNGKTAVQTFEFDISSVNDVPNIDTAFINLTLLEDAQSFSLDMNISDIEGDSLNVLIESDDVTILSVKQNFTSALTFGEYSDIPLSFTLTALKDANGIATISVTVNDGLATTTRYFDIDITAVNDAPKLGTIFNAIVYKNFLDKNITFNATDVENDILTYSATAIDSSLVSGITFNDNIMTITSLSGVSGSTDINVTVTDGNDSSSKLMNLNILSFEAGDSANQTSTIDVIEGADGVTTKLTISDNLNLQITENADGTSSQEIQVAGVTVKTVSNLTGAKTEFMPTGTRMTYSELDLSLEVSTSVTGTTAYVLRIQDLITRAISEFIGALTQITQNSNGEISIETSVRVQADSLVSVKANADGTARTSVTNEATTSTVVSTIQGSTTTIKETGTVQTVAGSVNSDGDYETRALVSTNANGETTSQFIKVSKTNPNDSTVVGSTLRDGFSIPAGSETEIFELDNILFIKTSIDLNQNLQI